MFVMDDLWRGRCRPSERRIRKGSRYDELMGLTSKDEKIFRQELTPEGKKAFEAYYQKQMEMANIAEEDSFVCGVRFGIGLILDAIGEYQSQLPQMKEGLAE